MNAGEPIAVPASVSVSPPLDVGVSGRSPSVRDGSVRPVTFAIPQSTTSVSP